MASSGDALETTSDVGYASEAAKVGSRSSVSVSSSDVDHLRAPAQSEVVKAEGSDQSAAAYRREKEHPNITHAPVQQSLTVNQKEKLIVSTACI